MGDAVHCPPGLSRFPTVHNFTFPEEAKQYQIAGSRAGAPQNRGESLTREESSRVMRGFDRDCFQPKADKWIRHTTRH